MFRNRSTYFYAAVFLGLFCYVAFIDKKIPGTKEREESATQLFKLNPDDVTAIEFTNAHGFFYFEKTDGHWEVKTPVATPADGATIDGIINQIAFTQPQRLIEVDGTSDKDIANLKEWGLLPTAAERVVIHTKLKNYELLIGRKMAINDNVYARASGHKNEPVRIIPMTIKESVEKDLSDFRSRNVFDFNPQNAVQVATRIAATATTTGEQCEVDFKDDKWTLQIPLVARAAETDVQSTLTKILGLRAVDFVSDSASNLSSYGLSTPTETVSVTLKDAEPMVLQIGGPVPNKPDQVYAQRLKSNSVFTITKSSLDDVLKALPNVRDRHVFPFDPNKALGLTFAFGPKNGQVQADHALWNTVDAGGGGMADVTKVTDLLAKLSQLETTPVLKDSATDLKPFGLDKPQGKITIQSPEFKPSPTLTLFIGKAENKLLYVRNSAEPFIYTVPDNSFDFLPASNLALRDARAINLKKDQLKSMTISVGAETAVNLVRSAGGTWSATNVKDRMVDTTKADMQASLFCQLQAKTWLGPVLPAYGLAKPALTISVMADQPTFTVLHIGATLPDGSHAAQIEGDPTAFAIADGDYGILNASTLQPIPKELPPATPVPAPASPK